MHRNNPKALGWRGSCPLGDLPECKLVMYGFELSLVWEVLQSPFYTDTFTAPWMTVACNRLYFCSPACQRTFESPEAELKTMRTRVTIALTGVVFLAMLRAAAFLALAAGATIVTWAPIPQLPWFTWGMWLFILVTPVQFIGGWSFYVGAWHSIRTRAISMDFLIALGTTVAYLYSVAVLFFPKVLPVAVAEREVYFEVSAVIIAFVLLGKYMEEMAPFKFQLTVLRKPLVVVGWCLHHES